MQREGDRREITGVTWKNKLELNIGNRSQAARVDVSKRITAGNLITGRAVLMIIRAKRPTHLFAIITASLLAACALWAQDAPPAATPPDQSAPVYKPKSPNIPARSDSEDLAIRYMLVVIRAQRQFNKQYDHFATTLAELVHSGSFTKRMVNPDRGDYTAGFKGTKDSYVLTMTPKNLDAQHRSFYAEDDGKIHADESKPADENSPLLK